jgi:hypothetical protein
MGILLAFAPFIVFAIVDRLLGPTPGLCAGAAVSAVLLARDGLTPGRSPKLLEIGTVILFAGLAAYALMFGQAGSLFSVRLKVDAGLLLIVLVSILVRRPFTLQYAREQAPPELWDSPAFVRANYVISAVWALAFALMVVADIVLVYIPSLPPRVGIVATILILVAAIKFTGWYPARLAAAAQA